MKKILFEVIYANQTTVVRHLAMNKASILQKVVEFVSESFGIYPEYNEDFHVFGYNAANQKWVFTEDDLAKMLPFKRKDFNLSKIFENNSQFFITIDQKLPFTFTVKYLKEYDCEQSQPSIELKVGEIVL